MININGVALVTSPIVHGALNIDLYTQKRGYVTDIRKIPICIRNEENGFASLPAVSGNSIKGITRRQFIQDIIEILGQRFYELDGEIQYLLLAGGASTNYSPKTVNQKVYKDIREKLPFVSVLGGVYRGHFIKGLINCGFMIPLVRENINLYNIPDIFKDIVGKPPALSDLNYAIERQPIGYNRMKEAGLNFEPESDENILEEIENEPSDDAVEETSEETVTAELSSQMAYFVKAIPVGTVMYHSFQLKDGANELEQSCFYAFIKKFVETGVVGGAQTKGHGQVKIYYSNGEDRITLDDLNKLAGPFNNYMNDNKDEIYNTLKSLPDLLQATPKSSKTKKS